MRGRILLVAALLTLAACSPFVVEGPDEGDVVTPVEDAPLTTEPSPRRDDDIDAGVEPSVDAGSFAAADAGSDAGPEKKNETCLLILCTQR